MSRSTSRFIDDSIRFPRETHRALREFARSKPWRGTVKERQEKFLALHARLCEIYSLETKLIFETREHCTTSIYSRYDRKRNAVILVGRLSVVSYLQMLAYALDCRGEQVVKWSVNLFKRRFPISFGRCVFVGHVLVRKTERERYSAAGNRVLHSETSFGEQDGRTIEGCNSSKTSAGVDRWHDRRPPFPTSLNSNDTE